MHQSFQIKIMKTYFVVILSFFTSLCFSQGKQQKNLELSISTEKNTISLSSKEYPKIKVQILNHTADTVILVKPGDGSLNGWRTPFTLFSVLDEDLRHSHPRKLDENNLKKMIGCGNINALKYSELIMILPYGKYEWDMGFDINKGPGRYSIKFLYRNIPDLKWKGIPLGQHDPVAMDIIRSKSKDITLVSNDIIFTVSN